jgi:hypothetical protein
MEQKTTAVDKQKFYDWITDALYPHKVMTAYEVSEVLAAKKYIPLATRQAVQPRMTELKEKGVLNTCGKKFDEHTKKWVTAYTLA